MFRMRMTRLRAAAAAALFSVALAAPALAGHDDWDDRDDGYRRGYPVHRHDRSCDRDERGDHHRRGGWDHDRSWRDSRGWSYGRGYWDRGHQRGRAHEYGCRPCGRRWDREDHFHRHLTQYHRVPYRSIPRVLVVADFGWLFRG